MAFERVPSGYPGVDEVFDYIRMGDNVVWQVSGLEEYRLFADAFVRQALKDGRNLIYMHYARHESLFSPQPGLKVFEFDPMQGFEPFTVEIYNRITEEGPDAFYIFDCLSELQVAWHTDQMMGNFFRVTCPYLFELNTVAYFPLMRGRHSFETMASIRDTTQVLIDVYTSDSAVYIHTLKAVDRDAVNIYLPHVSRSGGPFKPLDGGVALSRYYKLLDDISAHTQDQNLDSHDRFFAVAKLEFGRGRFRDETERKILESMMSKDPQVQRLIHQLFEPKDYFTLRDRMIGSGAIGGKACGMLLARKIAEVCLPEFREHTEPHDSFYIGSDVFYTYIVSNNCWRARIEQRTEEGYFSKAEELKQALLSGTFPENIREQFKAMLSYYGQSPIIVRSSSFLEDGFGNAFAGKYESVFCVNFGPLEKRLQAFEDAVRHVYASTMDISALEYRMQRGLEKKDEQMSILVQRVSGSWAGPYYLPGVAGVGYSRCLYKTSQDADPTAGMLRLVVGLGTKAVDRTEDDYPRLVNLDRPTATTLTSVADRHRFSQHYVDVIDRERQAFRSVSMEVVHKFLPDWFHDLMFERDYEAESALRDMGIKDEVWFITCQGFLERTKFPQLMRSLLKTLENVYGTPVDIEYAVNTEDGDFVINILQCRPLYVGQPGGKVTMPELPEEDVFFDLDDSSMGMSSVTDIDVVIEIDAKEYYEFPYARKRMAANAVGLINRYYKGKGKKIMLLAPGRLGTSSPELGVPCSFADISGFAGVCEVSDDRAGYMPELSYGSHMFQDLVEANIFYCAIWNDKRTLRYNPGLLSGLPNKFSEICPNMPELAKMFRVTEPERLAMVSGQQPSQAFYSDFAHSPSKLKATCEAVKKQYPSRRLVACLELHTFSSLTKEFLVQYKNCMDSTDCAAVYYNRHAIELKRLPDLSEEAVYEAFGKKDLKVLTDIEAVKEFISANTDKNSNVLMMSSSNFGGLDLKELAQSVM